MFPEILEYFRNKFFWYEAKMIMEKPKRVTEEPEVQTNVWNWFDSMGKKSKRSKRKRTTYD